VEVWGRERPAAEALTHDAHTDNLYPVSLVFRWSCSSNGQPNSACFTWENQLGNDAAPYKAPCQSTGCWYSMDDMVIHIGKGVKGGAPANPIDSVKTFWMHVQNGDHEFSTKVTSESSSSTSTETDKTFSASASISYGPASVSAEYSSAVKTSAANSLSSSSETTESYKVQDCGDKGYRWQYAYVFRHADGSSETQLTKVVLCARQPPSCPADYCATKEGGVSDCSCCSVEAYKGAPVC
jgi:hypothetical protein